MKPRWTAKTPGQGYLGKLVASLVLLGGVGLIASSGWWSLQFMLDPRSLAWMNAYLPASLKLPLAETDTRQTLAQVKAALKQRGLETGETIFLSRVPNRSDQSFDLLLPVLKRLVDCTDQCDRIVELRVYRVTPSRQKPRESVKLINELATPGLEEFIVLEPLVLARAAEPGSSQPLPFTALERFRERSPSQGIWLNLSGKQPHSDNPTTYGQILHYNPQSAHLSVMTPWTSPVGQPPIWQNVTGSKTPELVINQTVGLEPDLQIYQLQSRSQQPDRIKLQAISLKTAAIADWAFDDALKLARSGLWSMAEKNLRDLKPYYGKKGWTPAAQAQLDLISQHAQLAQAQANQGSADARQQVMVNLIDGRWEQAITIFQKSAIDRSDIFELLKVDSGRLWQRVATTLKIDPSQSQARAWGALILTAKQGKPTALAWLTKQSTNGNGEIQALLKQLDSTFADSRSGTSLTGALDSARPTPSPSAAPPKLKKPSDTIVPKLAKELPHMPESVTAPTQAPAPKAEFYSPLPE